MTKSGPTENSGDSTGSSTPNPTTTAVATTTAAAATANPTNDQSNGRGRGGSGDFNCPVCNKPFATKRALSGHKNAHRVIPGSKPCCLHGRNCQVVVEDQDKGKGEEKPALATQDLLREWMPIYAAREAAEAAGQPSDGTDNIPVMEAEEEEEDDNGLELELKL